MPIAVHLGEGVKLSAPARVESRPTLGTGVGGDRGGAAEGGDGGVHPAAQLSSAPPCARFSPEAAT
jgi:hypothetical protein